MREMYRVSLNIQTKPRKERWTNIKKSRRRINPNKLQGGKCDSVYYQWFANDDFDCVLLYTNLPTYVAVIANCHPG